MEYLGTPIEDPECACMLLTVGEMEFLRHYGGVLAGLWIGELAPITDSLRHFVSVSQEEVEPVY